MKKGNQFLKIYHSLKSKKNLSPLQRTLLEEYENRADHYLKNNDQIMNDPLLKHLPDNDSSSVYHYQQLRTVDELLERDKQRDKDGFPRKIRIGRIIKPGRTGKDKIIIVPTTVEEKFYHDEIRYKNRDSSQNGNEGEEEDVMGGTGDGEEGQILGEVPVHQEGQGQGGAGQGNGEGHDVTSNAYDLGKILTEKFKLPNLKDKGKKKTFTRYKYDLTDRNRGFGQFLDKKATLKKIIQTNRTLGRLKDVNHIDSTQFLIDPKDKVYRILSKEKDYESQALVFFLRDYSASMYGKPTEIVTSQHLMIYSWLFYQYEKQVESRFVLHDSEAKEVPDFYTYYNLSIAGGTYIASAFKLVNEIILKNSLDRDYNIYIFYGTDGDDMDSTGKEALAEIDKMLKYVSRIGITVVKSRYSGRRKSAVESYIESSSILEKHAKLIHMAVLSEDSDENKIIEGIRQLIKE